MTNFTSSKNQATIVGTVYEANLAIKVSKAGNTYVGGSVHVETSENNVVEVKYGYVAEKTKTGAINNNFRTLAGLATDVDRSQAGFLTPDMAQANAQKFAINGGNFRVKLTPSIAMNDFVNQEGEFAGGNILDGGFVSTSNLPQDCATFKSDMFIQSAVREIRGEDETGRLVLNGMFFDYTGKAHPVKTIVENAKGVEYFEDLLADGGVLTQIWGNIINSQIVQTNTIESAFGEANVVTTTRTRREFVVTGASTETYEMNEFAMNFLKEAKQKRETHLADTKARHDEYQANKRNGAGAPATPPAGFGNNAGIPSAPTPKPANKAFSF